MSNINVYCDESSHLEHDHKKVMGLCASWAEMDAGKVAARRLIDLKKRHGLKPTFDMKWVAVSPAKIEFYRDVVNYFFDNDNLNFRCLIVPDKEILDHKAHSQTHDDWYYKMLFYLLKQILSRKHRYRIYLDIKDTRSNAKVVKLQEVIRNSMLDFDSSIVEHVQQVRSHEVQLLQLGDLLLGAVCYANRELNTSAAKLALVQLIRERTNYRLTRSTLPSERKFNIFRWNPRGSGDLIA
jgi:hypothetical protein